MSPDRYNTRMETVRLPICPAVAAIFPGQLHLVSSAGEGMRQLVRFCRELHHPLGVVFTSGASGPSLARVGTLAYLVKPRAEILVEPQSVLVVGQARFHIQELHYDRPYLEATVESWPWLQEPRPDWRLVEQLGRYLHRYVTALAEVLPPTLLPEMLLSNTATLGVLGAALLQVAPAQKQHLLEIPTARGLLTEVLRYMRVYVPIAERLATMQPERQTAYERIFFN